MAYQSKCLSALAYANGHTSWHYRAEGDTRETVDSTGYFNGASRIVRIGDVIRIQAPTGAGIEVFDRFVSSNENGHVAILPLSV